MQRKAPSLQYTYIWRCNNKWYLYYLLSYLRFKSIHSRHFHTVCRHITTKEEKKTQIDISLIFILSFMTYMKFNIHTIYIHMTWIECNIIKICEKYYKWSTSLICFACFGCVWICISLAFLESFIILNISHKNSLWKEIILIHLFGLSHATKLKWFPYIDA